MGHEPILRALIGAGADLEATMKSETDKDMRPLMFAAREGRLGCARALIEAGADVDAIGGIGFAAADFASRSNHPRCLSALAKAGADLDRARWNCNPMALAIYNGHLACVRALIKAGASLEATHRSLKSPAMAAATLGQLACLALLADAGADLRARKGDGVSRPCVADHAAEAGQIDCLRFLQSRDVPLDQPDPSKERGATPLILAARGRSSSFDRPASPPDHAACVELLVKAGAQLERQDGLGMKPAAIAAAGNNPGCMAALIAAGAIIDALDDSGRTAAMLSARNAKGAACLSLLIEAGTDLRAVDSEGLSLLDHAAFSLADPLCGGLIRSALEREALDRTAAGRKSLAAPRL